VQYSKGDTWGYVAFDKALSEEDVAYVKEKINTLSSKPVTWVFLEGG
jgi:lupus La protein